MTDPKRATAEATACVLADIDATLAEERAAARARTAAAAERVLATACPAFDATPQRRATASPRPLPNPKPVRPLSYLATAAAIALWVVAQETWAAISYRLRRWRRG